MTNDMNKKVRFFSQSFTVSFRNRKKFKSFVEYILTKEGKILNHINIVFCTDEELRMLNIDFLKHDFYTDILTFDLSKINEEITADIYISLNRIRENAKIFNVPFSRELHRVMIHGILHLCGYKDKKSFDFKRIRAAEDKYLSKYFKRQVSYETRNISKKNFT